MSLFAALTTSAGGLSAQSSAIGNISDNLSNSQTTGFKSIGTNFESLVTQSNSQVNDPGGVRATPQYNNDVQGSLVSSSVSTSLAISGEGFFPVRVGVVNADGTTSIGTTPYYTRAGDFTLNADGYLVNGAGFYLTGYEVDSEGDVDASQTDAIQLSALLDNPVATSSVAYSANLPANVTSTLASTFESSPSTIQIYDSLGAQHTMSLTWTKQAADAHAAASVTIQDYLTLTSTVSGTFGNDIDVVVEPGTNPSTYKITISVPGQEDEEYDNIAAATFWASAQTAINAGSRLVSASLSGTAPSSVTETTYELEGGTGDEMNWTATAEEAGCITFSSLETGTAANGITVVFANDGAHAGMLTATISDGTVSETYNNLDPASGNAFWTTLAEYINQGQPAGQAASTLIMATAGAGTTAPAATDSYTLDGGQEPEPSSNYWLLTVSVPGGGGTTTTTVNGVTTTVINDYTATIPFTFNSSTTTTASAGTVSEITSSTGTNASGTYTVNSTGDATVTLPLNFSGSGATGTQSVAVDFGTFGSSSSGVTQFADSSETVSVSSFDQNGIPRGSFEGLEIDENGFVSLNYDNGQSRIIAQIPIVQFFAQDQLQRVSGGAYLQTLASGNARYSTPGTNGAGTIVGNSLESSNVDIATEFTKLIQAQQVYSANAKAMSTVNNMLQEVVNIIR